VNRRSNLMSGVLGGLVVAVVGAILLAAGAVDTGSKTTTIVQRQAPLSSGSPGSPAAQEAGGALTVGDIYKNVGPGVAFIQATIVQTTPSPFGFPQQQRGLATGSGFVLNKDGYIATNAHVVSGAKDVQVSFGKGNPTPARVVGRDPSTDLAVIKVDPTKVKLTPVTLGDSNTLKVGDPVVAIGNPFGFDDTVTTGIVSALGREIQAPNNFSIDHTIQTDAAINPGNSGGPLLDASAHVLGLNDQIETNNTTARGEGSSSGVGFAIPSNAVKRVADGIVSGSPVKHPYVGVELRNSPSGGAQIGTVQQNSPATTAGLQPGDVVTAVDGKAVTTTDQLIATLDTFSPGTTITMKLNRQGQTKQVHVKLGDRPAQAQRGG
jgi:S1-C subfamily serine protease